MKHIEDFSIIEQEAQIGTRAFSGAPRYPIVAEYLGLVTKSADSGSMSELTPFLKKKAKQDQPTNSIVLLHFVQEILQDIKEAQPDLYSKLTGDQILQKIKEVTPK